MKRLLLLFVLLPSLAWAGDDDDFGTWLELGAEKALPRNMEIGLDGGLRMKDGSTLVDRWDLGASFGYKVHKYLKLSAGYSFLHDYSPEKRKEKYEIKGDAPQSEFEEYTYEKGFNLYKKHWSARHRIYVEASSSVKLWKTIRLSGRLRYQFTHKSVEKVDRYRYSEKIEVTPHMVGFVDGSPVFKMEEEDPEINHDEWDIKSYDAENRQVLRSRLKIELDKKHLAWSPYVSVEFHNNVASGAHMNFDKLRTSVGTTYKINKQNSVGLAYVLTLNRMEQPHERMHALSASYSYDF